MRESEARPPCTTCTTTHLPGGAVGRNRERLGRADGRGVPTFRDGLPGGQQMTYRVLDTIVLDRDLPDHGLRKGDLGAVVQLYEPDGLEVEFVTASGRTAAVLTLTAQDVRPVADNDLVSVRPCSRSTVERQKRIGP